MLRKQGGLLAVAIAAIALLATSLVISGGVQAADHLEAPEASEDGRNDITDLYAFAAPDGESTVVVLGVNPLAGVLGGTTFAKKTLYQIDIDDGVKKQKVAVRFNNVKKDRSQKVRFKINGERIGKGKVGETIYGDRGIRFTAGVYDDPFFFDLQAFNDQVKGEGGDRTFCDGAETDFLAGTNINALVFEIPNSNFQSSELAISAKTQRGSEVKDRVGRPAIATVLIPDGSEDDFNDTKVNKQAAEWRDEVKASLLALSGLDGSPYSDAEAQGIADFLIPDVLTIDTSAPTAFPNGRALSDDVIDAALGIVTGGFFGDSAVLTSDCVDANDQEFGTSFPYLADAN